MNLQENKNKYKKLCSKEKSIPLFSKDWWLDAVVGKDNWDVAIIEKNQEVIAALPYYKHKKYFFDIISLPKLTQNFKLWIKYPKDQKYTTKLSFEKDNITELINQFPKFDLLNLNLHYSLTNWLPFYWQKFKQTTRYTYIIEDLTNIEQLFKNLKSNIKTDIRKASKNLEVFSDDNIELFYEINKMTFDRQKMKMPYSLEFIKNLDNACKEHNCRKIFFAKDKENRIHATCYIVWDEMSAYYLMGGANPDLRNSGASSFLNWEAIKFSATVTQKFDFEGSMIEPVEAFFRGFGAIQKPYFRIAKINSRLIKIFYTLMS